MLNRKFGPTFGVLRSVALAALVFAPALARSQDNFDAGRTRISVSAGTSNTYSGNYFQLGIGAGYYVGDGLELGLDARSWLGGPFNIHEVAPSVTYVLQNFGSFMPYAGLLYRKTFIEDRDNLSAYGARGGIFLQQSSSLVLRAGVAAIRYQNCEETGQSDCTEFYPEISAGFYF